MTHVFITLQYAAGQRSDLGLPLDVSAQSLADTLAEMLQIPAADKVFNLSVISPKGVKEIPSSDTLAEAGVLCGMILQMDSKPLAEHTVSYLVDENGMAYPVRKSVVLGKNVPGSSSKVDLDFSALDKRNVLSTRHAYLLSQNNQLFLSDEYFSSGTWINGQRVKNGRRIALKYGDRISLGPPDAGGIGLTLANKSPSGKSLKEAVPRGANLIAQDGLSFSVHPYSVVGRNEGAPKAEMDINLAFLDTARIVSRSHATIILDRNTYKICDERSRNGTWLNGTRLEKGRSYPLQDGDVLVFGYPQRGGVRLVFKIE